MEFKEVNIVFSQLSLHERKTPENIHLEYSPRNYSLVSERLMSNLAALTQGRHKAGSLPCRKLVIIADGISCIFLSIGHILSCILWEKRVFSASLHQGFYSSFY